jgi:hypothetical protein
MFIVAVIFTLVAVYLAAGIGIRHPFVTKGVTQIDEGAAGSKWGFRIIIIPGVMVFWPMLLKKWMKASKKINVEM